MTRAIEDDPAHDPGFDRETEDEAEAREDREREEERRLAEVWDDPRTRPRED